jgi:hypothetical protein
MYVEFVPQLIPEGYGAYLFFSHYRPLEFKFQKKCAYQIVLGLICDFRNDPQIRNVQQPETKQSTQ